MTASDIPPDLSPDDEAAADSDHEAALAFLLHFVDLGIITRREMTLVLATRVYGQSLRALLGRTDRRAYDRINKQRQRAEARLRRHLAAMRRKLARQQGLKPEEISLAQVVRAVLLWRIPEDFRSDFLPDTT